MTELEEAINRLGEVEYQLRANSSPFAQVPPRPWELFEHLASDVAKVKEFLDRVQRRM